MSPLMNRALNQVESPGLACPAIQWSAAFRIGATSGHVGGAAVTTGLSTPDTGGGEPAAAGRDSPATGNAASAVAIPELLTARPPRGAGLTPPRFPPRG